MFRMSGYQRSTKGGGRGPLPKSPGRNSFSNPCGLDSANGSFPSHRDADDHATPPTRSVAVTSLDRVSGQRRIQQAADWQSAVELREMKTEQPTKRNPTRQAWVTRDQIGDRLCQLWAGVRPIDDMGEWFASREGFKWG